MKIEEYINIYTICPVCKSKKEADVSVVNFFINTLRIERKNISQSHTSPFIVGAR